MRAGRPLRGALTALALLFCVTLLAPAGARADGGVGFRVEGVPGSSMDGGFIVVTAAPGSSSSGWFYATNSQTKSANLTVYPADGLTGATTGIVYSDAGATLQEAGAWITPDRRSVFLRGNSEQRIDFSVRIPAGATPGDHVGAVVLEQRGSGGGAISQVIRNVVPVLVAVTGPASPQVVVRSTKIGTLPGTEVPAVTVALRNTGLKICRPSLTVAIQKVTGGPRMENTNQLDVILPGDRAPYAMPWPKDIPAGEYNVEANVGGCGVIKDDERVLVAPPPKGEEPVETTPTDSGANANDKTGLGASGKAERDGATKKRKKKRAKASSERDDAGPVITPRVTPGDDGRGGSGAGSGEGKGIGGWLKDAGAAIAEHAPAVAKRAGFPLLVLLGMGLILFVQEAIDRRDPKLALAPLHREDDLPFEPDPRGRGEVEPLPTPLTLTSSLSTN